MNNSKKIDSNLDTNESKNDVINNPQEGIDDIVSNITNISDELNGKVEVVEGSEKEETKKEDSSITPLTVDDIFSSFGKQSKDPLESIIIDFSTKIEEVDNEEVVEETPEEEKEEVIEEKPIVSIPIETITINPVIEDKPIEAVIDDSLVLKMNEETSIEEEINEDTNVEEELVLPIIDEQVVLEETALEENKETTVEDIVENNEIEKTIQEEKPNIVNEEVVLEDIEEHVVEEETANEEVVESIVPIINEQVTEEDIKDKIEEIENEIILETSIQENEKAIDEEVEPITEDKIETIEEITNVVEEQNNEEVVPIVPIINEQVSEVNEPIKEEIEEKIESIENEIVQEEEVNTVNEDSTGITEEVVPIVPIINEQVIIEDVKETATEEYLTSENIVDKIESIENVTNEEPINEKVVSEVEASNIVEESVVPVIAAVAGNIIEKTIEETNKDEVIKENITKETSNNVNIEKAEDITKVFEDIFNEFKIDKKVKKKKKKKNNKKISLSKETLKNYLPKKKEHSEVVEADSVRPATNKAVRVCAIVVWVCIGLAIIGCIGAGIFAGKLLEGKPEFDANRLKASDSTIIYDCNGNEIVELGLYLRDNVDYDQMPNCLIDAFLSIEDSRFFEHFGFDIPRFTKAAISNVLTGSFGQGGSTMTMQLVKNSYFQVDADGASTMAANSGLAGVQRKMQEIVLAIECNNTLSKEETIALYINKINFGNNIRGVQKAAEYYFGKDAKDLSLVESCFLAGIINAPNLYNPYNELYKNNENYIYLNSNITYLENAQERTAEVLDLMVYHGYISEEEAELAKCVKIENLLAGIDSKFSSYTEYYQDFLDAVIDEVTEKTGKDPYTTPMQIYTTMDPYMQKTIYEIETEQTDLQYTNDLEQSALVILNNQTGELVALGGGRNQAQSARQFNRATSAYVQPGSSIKPVLEYVLAFDKLGWSTAHTITDQPYYLYGSKILVSNAGDQGYTGDMLITEAIARSLNSPAVQTLEAVVEEIDEEGVVEYLNSIGIRATKETFDLQWAIGGNTCLVTPVQLAAAHGMLMNEGYYIEPHTVSKIIFFDGSEYVADTEGTQVVSKAAAYMTATCEEYNVSGPFYNLMQILKRDYPVYAKTGTTDWSDAGVAYGIPIGAPKDMWMVSQTSNYTISVWLGFDKTEKGSYFTSSEDMNNLKGRICKYLLDTLDEHYDYHPHAVEKPDDVSEITIVKGAYPYCTPSEGYETATGYIKTSALEENPLTDVGTVLANLTDKNAGMSTTHMTGYIDEWNSANIEIKQGGYYCYDGLQDISATNYDGDVTEGTGRCYFPHYRNTDSTFVGALIKFYWNDEYFSEFLSTDGFAYAYGVPETGDFKACNEYTGVCIDLYRSTPSWE